MGCPVHGGDDPEPSDEGTDEADDGGGGGPALERRSLLRSALAIGGASALSTVVGMFGMPETAAAADGRGVSIAERANRQHSWNAYERQAHGTFLPPDHHLLLFANYRGDGEPSAEDRRRMRAALDGLEEAFEWDHEGLLFTVGYSTSYLERFEDDPPRGLQTDNGRAPRMLSAQQVIDGPTFRLVDLPPGQGDLQPDEPEDEEEVAIDLHVTLDREDPVADDDYDVCIHLASDHVQHLLLAERALWGLEEEVRDVEFEDASLDGVLTRPTEYPDRRVGFAGNEALSENVDVGSDGSTAEQRFEESVDQGAELSMGYNDLYKNSQPREDNVTILEDQRFSPGPPNWQPPGAWANGSVMHVSRLDNDLEGWYGENTDTERRHRMFSPHHTKADVGNVGENLADTESNAPSTSSDLPMRDLSSSQKDVAERTQEDFEAGRNIGHAQKIARARAGLEDHFRNEDGGAPLNPPQRDDPVAQEREDDLPNTDGDQIVEAGFLRRDFNTVDDGKPGTHFVALQAFSIYLPYMRHAMNGIDFDTSVLAQPETLDDPSLGFEHESDADETNPEHGILEYITTQRRGQFVLPPIRQRALPHASAIKLVDTNTQPETGLGGATLPQYADPDGEFTLDRAGANYRVRIADDDLADDIDPDSLRFGFYRDVNAGGGAEPRGEGDGDVFVFPVEETRLPAELRREETDEETPDDETVRARLYAEREDDRKPVFGTALVPASSPGGGEDEEDEAGEDEGDEDEVGEDDERGNGRGPPEDDERGNGRGPPEDDERGNGRGPPERED